MDVPPMVAAGGVRSIAAGTRHMAALLFNGSLVCWGLVSIGEQCKVPSGMLGVTRIVAAGSTTIALAPNATITTVTPQGVCVPWLLA
jgi:alpha-tubulin suppressor-like RCC1 family protein